MGSPWAAQRAGRSVDWLVGRKGNPSGAKKVESLGRRLAGWSAHYWAVLLGNHSAERWADYLAGKKGMTMVGTKDAMSVVQKDEPSADQLVSLLVGLLAIQSVVLMEHRKGHWLVGKMVRQ